MTQIMCLDCKVPTVSHPSGRCLVHQASRQRAVDRAPARRQRKRILYDSQHEADRARWQPLVDAGGIVCRRCTEPIEPGTKWDLGHGADGSRPEHPACNRGNR